MNSLIIIVLLLYLIWTYVSKEDKYVTLVDKLNTTDKNVTLVDKVNTTDKYHTSVYTIDGGHLFDVVDKALSTDKFSRTIGNMTKVIDVATKTVDSTIIDIRLKPILATSGRNQEKLDVADPNIGTFDIETFNDNGISKVYALGFHVSNNTKTFYIDEATLDSDKLILNCSAIVDAI